MNRNMMRPIVVALAAFALLFVGVGTVPASAALPDGDATFVGKCVGNTFVGNVTNDKQPGEQLTVSVYEFGVGGELFFYGTLQPGESSGDFPIQGETFDYSGFFTPAGGPIQGTPETQNPRQYPGEYDVPVPDCDGGEEPTDTDGDGTPDSTDSDDDNDGVTDYEDAFPLDPNESIDTDGDGVGDNTDLDDDGDNSSDQEEIAAGTNPLDPTDFPSEVEEPTQEAGIDVVKKERPVVGPWATAWVKTTCDGSIQKRVIKRVRWSGKVIVVDSEWRSTRLVEAKADTYPVYVWMGPRHKRVVADFRVVCLDDSNQRARTGWSVLRR